jgi:hypothetical protein
MRTTGEESIYPNNFGTARSHQVYNGGLGAKFGYQKLLGSHDIEYECSRVSRAPCKEDPTVSAGKLIREQGGEQTSSLKKSWKR